MLIETKKLKEAITNASYSTVKERESILYNVKLESETNTIKVKAQNNITSITQTIQTDSEETFSTIIDPVKMLNVLKEIKEEKLDLVKEEKTITIRSGKFKTTIKTLNSNLYPEMQEPKEKKEICQIEAEKLKKLIKETIYCPDKNDIAREYTGVYFEIEENTIKATATDHYRLINVKTMIDSNESVSFIVENSGANLINRVPLKGELKLYLTDSELIIESEDIVITSKLIKGSFPDYNQILLSRETSNTIEINREGFKEAIKRGSVLSENREITVKVSLADKTIKLISQNQEGETAEDEIKFETINAESDLIIKLDSKFLLDFINQIRADSVVFMYKTSEEPIMLEAEENGYSYKYIMTPIVE